MNKKQKEQLIKKVLIDTAIADIAINDLGLTLNEPAFFPWDACYVHYGIDSEFGNVIRFETLVAMSWHLCTLKNHGIKLAIQLVKNSGLLNYHLTDEEVVTEEFIENGLRNCSKDLIAHKVSDDELEKACYYENLFRAYCLDIIEDIDVLNQRIIEKIESYYKQ